MATDETKVVISIDTILRGLDKTVRGLDTVEKKLRTVAGIKALTGKTTSAATFDKTATAAQKLLNQQQKLAVQTQELVNRQEKARQSTEKLRIASERLARAQQQAAKASQPRLSRAADAHVREFRERERAAQRAQREIERINTQTRRQAERNAREQERVETRLANHRIKEAERTARAQARALERNIAAQRSAAATTEAGGVGLLGAATLGGVVGGATVAAIAALSSAVRSGAQAWIEYASKLENARIAFATMLGGAADAEAHLNRLKQFALETPFAFDELVDASQKMQALGFRAEEVIPVLRDVGNAVAAAGGGSERLERVIKALSDVRARGTLQSQEIRQFAEAGISAFQILREETGKTTVELQDMVEKGQISADFFLKAFRKFSQIHFGDLMEQQSKTFLGALSNIRDVLLQLASKAFEPLFNKISEIAVRVQAELQKTKDLEGVADVLGNAFFELGGFLAEKIGEGILARMLSPAFWQRFANQAPRMAASALRSFGTELQNSIAEAATGRKRGEITAADILKADEKQAKGLKGVSLAAKAAEDRLKELADTEQRGIAINKKASEIYDEVRESISDVSSVSSELATKQALLRAGVTDLTTGYAALAIALATAADAQRTLNERQEAEAKRVRGRNQAFRDQLEALRDSTRLASAELEAEPAGGLSELERFNRTIGAQIDGILEAAKSTGVWTDELAGLSLALDKTRTDLADFDVQLANKKAKEEADKLFKARLEVSRSLFELQREINQGIKGVDLTELEQTAERVTSLFGLKVRPDAFDPLIELFQAATTDPTKALELVQQILSTVRADLGPEFDNITQSIVNSFQAAAKLDKQLKETAERTAQLNRLFLGLRIEEERVQDRILDGQISEREGRAEILALQQRYKEEILEILAIELALAKTRKDPTAVLNIQAQIEEIERLGKVLDVEGQRINRELFGNIQSGFEDIFNSALDGVDSVLDAFKNLGRSILATLNRVAAQSLTEELFGDLLKPGADDTKGTIGGLLGRLFGLKPKTDPVVSANTTATDANTAALNALTTTFGGQGADAKAGLLGAKDPTSDPIGFVTQAAGFVSSLFGDKPTAPEDQLVTAEQGTTVIDAINIASDLLAQVVNGINALIKAIGGEAAAVAGGIGGGLGDTVGQLVNFGSAIAQAFGGGEGGGGEEEGGGPDFSFLGDLFGGGEAGGAQDGKNLIQALNINSDELRKNTQALKDSQQSGSQQQSFSQFASLFSGGAATGDFVPAVPRGRLVRVAEAGHDEAILTTDPKHASRQVKILREYLARTRGLFGRFRVPEFASGGWAQQAEMNMLNSIQRSPSLVSSVPDTSLATSGGQGMNVRVINQLSSKTATRPYINSEEGVRDIMNIISANAPEIGRRIGVK